MPSGQSVHSVASGLFENRPTGQPRHRLGSTLLLSAWNVPVGHFSLESQNDRPASSGYFPSGHVVHSRAFAPLENVCLWHGVQLRSVVAVAFSVTHDPAAHTRC